jgi:probable H4MPT-linked C1 transfer pathway protein
MPIIGLDIGGANLKASNGQSHSISRSFAIWKEPQRLATELCELLRMFNQESAVRGHDNGVQASGCTEQAKAWAPTLAVTMTAELADCFATKAEGVNFILDAVQQVAGESEVLVWQTGGEFVSPAEARELVPLVAAANWHALATWTARITAGADGGAAILIDLGSTTCDIIPLMQGLPMSAGRTDVERLMSGELVYTGVRRTPLMAVASSVLFRNERVPLAAELFATTLDVYLLLGEIAEDASDTITANGRPATIDAAWDRIARSICCDRSECSLDEARAIAADVKDHHHHQISSALQRVASRLTNVSQIILSGEGEPILRGMITSPGFAAITSAAPAILSLRDMLGPAHSSCACAYALARLAAESGGMPQSTGQRLS